MNDNICISPNVGRYFGLVTGPPPPAMEAMEAMEAEAMERFRRERSSVANLTRINLIFNLRHRRSEVTVFTPFCLFVTCEKKKFSLVCWSVCLSKRLSVCCSSVMSFYPVLGVFTHLLLFFLLCILTLLCLKLVH